MDNHSPSHPNSKLDTLVFGPGLRPGPDLAPFPRSKGGYEDAESLDAVDLTGWWLAAQIGAKDAWLYHDDRTATLPPESGWTMGGKASDG